MQLIKLSSSITNCFAAESDSFCLPKKQISILKYNLKSSHVVGSIRALTAEWVSENCTKANTTFSYMLFSALFKKKKNIYFFFNLFFFLYTEAWDIRSHLIIACNFKKLFSVTREDWLSSVYLNHHFNQFPSSSQPLKWIYLPSCITLVPYLIFLLRKKIIYYLHMYLFERK